MQYFCHGCMSVVRAKGGRCVECGLREDVDQFINMVGVWKGLNDQAKEKYISIIEKGLDS